MRKPLTPTQKMRRSVQAKIRRIEKKGGYVPQEIKQTVKEARYQTLASMRRDKFSRLKSDIAEAFGREFKPASEYGEIPFDEVELPDQKDIVFDNVRDTIKAYSSEGSELLNKALNSEIRKWGDKAIARAMASANEDLVQYARDISAYSRDKGMMHRAIHDFFSIIKDERIRNGDTEEIGNAMDRMTDMGNES